jgi:hypothetical protein
MTSNPTTYFVHLPGAVEQRIVRTLLHHFHSSDDEATMDSWWARLCQTLSRYGDDFGSFDMPVAGMPGAFMILNDDIMQKLTLLQCHQAGEDFGN